MAEKLFNNVVPAPAVDQAIAPRKSGAQRPGRRLALQRWAALAAVGGAALLAGQTAFAQTSWKLATGYPESSFHVVNLHRFAQEVQKASGGKLQIEVHAGGQLVKAADIRGAIGSGSIDAGEMFGPGFGALHPAFAVDALPFLATDYAAAERLGKAARPTIRDKLASQGLVLLYSVPWPPQGLFSNKPIESIADFQGLRLRENSPPVKRLAELLGSTAVRVETPELEAALKNKTIDAVFTSAAQGVDTQMWRQLPYFYPINAWLPRNLVVVSKKSFDALDPALRDTVMKLAAEAEVHGRQLSEENAKSTLEQLRRAGAKIEQLPSPVRNRMDRIGEKVAKEVAASDKTRELLNILLAYFAVN